MSKVQALPVSGNQAKHGYMLARMVEYIKLTGYTDIKANITGLDPPPKIYWQKSRDYGYTPDLTGYRKGVYHIFEIETEDTLCDAQTKAQWKLFSKFASQNGNAFVVVVPEGYKDEVFKQVTKLDIDVTDVLTID